MSARVLLCCFFVSLGSAAAAAISGTVWSAEGGGPVAKARLTLRKAGGALSGFQVVDTATADSLGRYAFRKLAPERWQVEAQAPGRRASSTGAAMGDSGESVTADLVLRKGAGIEGPGAVTGTVREGGAGRGLRAVVVLSRLEYTDKGVPRALPVDTARSDSLGRFILDSLDFRTDYLVTAAAPGYAPAADSAVSVAVGQTLNRSFVLEKQRGSGKRKDGSRKK